MPTLVTRNLTLSDWAARKDPDGKSAVIAEILNSNDELLEDVVWKEANGVENHTGVVRTGLPEVYYRTINAGIPSSKSTTAKVQEIMSRFEARSNVDKELVDLNGNDPGFRLSEDVAFIEAMRQKVLKSIIYGDPKKEAEAFTGLHMRYNDSKAKSAQMVINADKTASGSNYCSIYLPVWGDRTCHCLFPKGSQAGLRQQDLGEHDAFDADGLPFRALGSLFSWKAGLFVPNWESVGRISNISLAKLADGSINLIDLLIDLTERVEGQSQGKPVIYVNKSIRTYLRKQVLAKANVNLTYDTVAGKRVLAFDGIPVRALKALEFAEPAYK